MRRQHARAVRTEYNSGDTAFLMETQKGLVLDLVQGYLLSRGISCKGVSLLQGVSLVKDHLAELVIATEAVAIQLMHRT